MNGNFWNPHVQTIKALGGYLQGRYPGMTLLSAFVCQYHIPWFSLELCFALFLKIPRPGYLTDPGTYIIFIHIENIKKQRMKRATF